MNTPDIRPFEFDGQPVRTITDDTNEPWFLASDVAAAPVLPMLLTDAPPLEATIETVIVTSAINHPHLGVPPLPLPRADGFTERLTPSVVR